MAYMNLRNAYSLCFIAGCILMLIGQSKPGITLFLVGSVIDFITEGGNHDN